MRFNTEMKERLNREHANSLDLSSKLQRITNDMQIMKKSNEEAQHTSECQKMKIDNLMREKDQIEAALSDSKTLFSTGKLIADASESQLRHMLVGRDCEISEVSLIKYSSLLL